VESLISFRNYSAIFEEGYSIGSMLGFLILLSFMLRSTPLVRAYDFLLNNLFRWLFFFFS